MTIPTSVQLKLNRAYEHLQALDEEVGSYLEQRPWKPVYNVQPSNQSLVLMEIHVIAEPAEYLGLLIGDCLHNLRSSLDHLACRLVESNGGRVTRRTQFPILDQSPTDRAGKPVALQVEGGVAPAVLAVIESLQPYQRGQAVDHHPLSILSHLSNADKHRLLHVTATGFADSQCYLNFPDGRRVGGSFRDVARHETPIAAFMLNEPFDKTKHGAVEVEIAADVFVAIRDSGPWDGRPVILVLNDILEFIYNVVVDRLHPFLN